MTSFRAAAFLTLVMAAPAHAICLGSGNFQTCYDNDGNMTSTSTLSGVTELLIFHPATGYAWTETSSRIGKTVYRSGYSSSQGAWSNVEEHEAGSRIILYSDANRETRSQTCFRTQCF